MSKIAANVLNCTDKNFLESVALNNLNQKFGGRAIRSGFRTELLRHSRLCQAIGNRDWYEMFRFRPDGYLKFSVHRQVWLIAIEIEDTAPLTPEKLKTYADLWFDFDSSDHHNFGLIITDRYGRACALDLQDIYYSIHPGNSSACRAMFGHVPQLSFEEILAASLKHRVHRAWRRSKEDCIQSRRVAREEATEEEDYGAALLNNQSR